MRTVQGWLLPPTCIRCGSSGRAPAVDLCADCESEFALNAAACPACAVSLPSNMDGACAACRRRPRPFDSAVAPYRYEYPVDRLVWRFKYEGRLEIGRVLAELLAGALAARRVMKPDALIPVPLALAKLRERGFNQALELARPVARALSIPVRTDLCTRVRLTEDQAGLAARERRRNVRGAFAASDQAVPRHVALIDDVLTTGSTCEELARELKRAGAVRVDVWVIARANARTDSRGRGR
ncbi:MAG TPA: ComF family protein [Steroidobacteraceae bacterium]|nr:ComF family protein [Steroidobacteraceae bacterium]